MNLYEYLKPMAERLPSWLAEFTPESRFDRNEFFGSRLVFYPGSGTDGHAVKLFGSTHSAHCFIHADYGLTETTLEAELVHPDRRFFGYHTLARLKPAEHHLVSGEWIHHEAMPMPEGNRTGLTPPFAFMEILERDSGYDDTHGAARLAILFLGVDAIATYDACFCQRNGTAPPFAILLQDHGFGGNYDKFGFGGLLERAAHRGDALPQFLLVGRNTHPWAGFTRIPTVTGDCGGMHATPRYLHERRENSSPSRSRLP